MVPDKVLNSVVRYLRKELRRVDPDILSDLKRDLARFNASRGKWDAPRRRKPQFDPQSIQEIGEQFEALGFHGRVDEDIK